ncbi:MAG: hypothetical protein CMC96_14780 [Flavobacteriales bacterium]|nr:hypothetical protein [Flavobacteriales bacterium]|tara:strand:- start:11677 stop:13038 length:1362 start_codon:yes stop_codon:yes gene_type:complete
MYEQLFDLIDDFTKSKTGRLIKRKSLLDDLEASIQPSGKNFSVTFDWDRRIKGGKQLDVGQHYKKVELQFKDQSYILSELFLGTHSPPQFTGQTSFLYTKGYSFKKKFYYRLLIPLERELRYHYILGTRSSEINGDSLIFRIIQNDKKKYFLIIESEFKQSYDEFSEKTFALKNALGYLTGYLAGNGGYFFAYTKKKMEAPAHIYRCEFRNTIISGYAPLNSNPYSYLHSNKKLAKKYYDKKLLRTINQDEFSLLCQRLYDSVELSSAIILMLESSVASLLFMPGGYAIVLETLADIIKPKKKQKVAPMTKSLSKKVRQECSAVIEKYKNEFSKDNHQALLDRISWLNQATNKAKLRAPFDYLKIDLLEEDLDILQARNDFLHGRVPDMTKGGEVRSLDRQNKDLYYASVRFYTLLNILILKWIGYDNRVVNYPKINEAFTEIKLKEEPYRQI